MSAFGLLRLFYLGSARSATQESQATLWPPGMNSLGEVGDLAAFELKDARRRQECTAGSIRTRSVPQGYGNLAEGCDELAV